MDENLSGRKNVLTRFVFFFHILAFRFAGMLTVEWLSVIASQRSRLISNGSGAVRWLCDSGIDVATDWQWPALQRVGRRTVMWFLDLLFSAVGSSADGHFCDVVIYLLCYSVCWLVKNRWSQVRLFLHWIVWRSFFDNKTSLHLRVRKFQ